MPISKPPNSVTILTAISSNPLLDPFHCVKTYTYIADVHRIGSTPLSSSIIEHPTLDVTVYLADIATTSHGITLTAS